MKKKVMILLLLAMSLLTLCSVSAMANEVECPEVTIKKGTLNQCGDMFWVGDDGYVWLDEKGEVVLERATITESIEYNDAMVGILLTSSSPVVVRLVGDNTIILPGDARSIGIVANCPEVTFTGFGTLTVSFEQDGRNCGIYGTDEVSVNNTQITVNGEEGITASCLNLQNASLSGICTYSEEGTWTFDDEAVLKGGDSKALATLCSSVEDLRKCSYIETTSPIHYNIFVNGEELTSIKPSITCGDGKAYLEFTQYGVVPRLVLDNATITKGYYEENEELYIGILLPDANELAFVGKNTITLEGSENTGVCGIRAYGPLYMVTKYYEKYQRFNGDGISIVVKSDEIVPLAGCYCSSDIGMYGVNFEACGEVGLYDYGAEIFSIYDSRLLLYGSEQAMDSTKEPTYQNSPYSKVYVDSEHADGSSRKVWDGSTGLNSYRYVLIDEVVRSEVFVNGEEFMPEKTVIPCGEGTASYDFEKNELTLENATIVVPSTPCIEADYSLAVKYAFLPGNTRCGIFGALDSIVLKGTNVITLSDTELDVLNTGIVFAAMDSQVTFSGTGSLDISVGTNSNSFMNSTGLQFWDFSNATLILKDYVTVTVRSENIVLDVKNFHLIMKDMASCVLSGKNGAVQFDAATVSTDDMTTKFRIESDMQNADGSTAVAWDETRTEFREEDLYFAVLADARIADTSDVIHANTAWYGVTVTWTKATGPYDYTYRLLRRPVKEETQGTETQGTETPWEVVAENLKVTGYYDKTVTPGVEYRYAVVVCLDKMVGEPGKTAVGNYLQAPTIETVENRSGSVRVTWTAIDGADGYYVYRKDTQAGTWHFIGSTQKNLYFNDTNVEGGTVYYYAIKSFKKAGEDILTSASGSAKNTIYVKNNFVSKLSNQYSGILKVEFSPSPNCTGYEVVYWTKVDFSDAKTMPVKMAAATDKSITGLKKGTKYFVKVRAYKTMGGYTFYSNWSAIKELTLTK